LDGASIESTGNRALTLTAWDTCRKACQGALPEGASCGVHFDQDRLEEPRMPWFDDAGVECFLSLHGNTSPRGFCRTRETQGKLALWGVEALGGECEECEAMSRGDCNALDYRVEGGCTVKRKTALERLLEAVYGEEEGQRIYQELVQKG
jgi:hypothetical protein